MRMRNTAIMAVVVVIMGALVYFLEFRGAEEREAAEAVAERLLSFESGDVSGMTIDTPEADISLSRVDDTWRITAPYDLAADGTAADSIVSALQSANHERIIDETPDDLGRFGLAEPELSVTLNLTDGGTRSIAFGGGTPVGFNVFVRTGEDETVYTTGSSLKDTANKTLYDLRERSILSFTDADVRRVELARDGADVTVERQPDLGDGINRWMLSAPLEARADADTVSSLLQRLRTGNAVAFATDEPSEEQIAEFGLDDPEITVRLWTEESSSLTLLIGGSSEEPSGRYARREGSDAVMIIPTNVVNELPESPDAMRNRAIVDFARDRVEAIEIAAEGAPMRIEKDGVDWKLTAPRPLSGDAATASAMLTAALDLRTREFPTGSADEARFGFGQPDARVSFVLEALPGEDAGEGVPAETVTLLIGAATEVAGTAAGEATATESEDETGDEAGDEPATVAARYLRVEGEPTVFVIAQDDLDDIDVDLFALRSKTLVSFGQSELTRIEVIADDETLEIDRAEDGSWARAGVPLAPEQNTAVDDLLWRLNYLDMQGVVAEPEGDDRVDPAPYGLAGSALRVRAFMDATPVADVGVGADVPEDQLTDLPTFAARTQTYATVGDEGGIYRIDAALRDAVRTLLDALS